MVKPQRKEKKTIKYGKLINGIKVKFFITEKAKQNLYIQGAPEMQEAERHVVLKSLSRLYSSSRVSRTLFSLYIFKL